jgi:hypothetical protein
MQLHVRFPFSFYRQRSAAPAPTRQRHQDPHTTPQGTDSFLEKKTFLVFL